MDGGVEVLRLGWMQRDASSAAPSWMGLGRHLGLGRHRRRCYLEGTHPSRFEVSSALATTSGTNRSSTS
jgi:hypothetical protein